MFQSAYIRLSAWYVAIIMAISLLFSAWVYNAAVDELRFGLQRGVVHISIAKVIDATPFINDELLAGRQRVVVSLVLFNGAVLIVGAFGSYWLAKRTLRPIEESVEAQNRFTADASHELRTPLAAMKAEIEVALRDKHLTPSDARELMQSNLEEIDRMSGLAEGLLTLARSDAEPELAHVNLAKIATTVGRRLRPLADAKHVTITNHLQPVQVLADTSHVDKIIGIVLDNAIKYSPPHSAITITTTKTDGHGHVTITDEGEGIQPQDLPHIFDRFYRADSSRTADGYGLGLAIAQKLATDMKGSITATSTVGKGSTFVIQLPGI